MLRKLTAFQGTVLAILFALWMEKHMSAFDWFDWTVLGLATSFVVTTVVVWRQERKQRRLKRLRALRTNAQEAIENLRHSLLRRKHLDMLWDEAQYRYQKLLDALEAHPSPAAATLRCTAPALERDETTDGNAWDVGLFLGNPPLWRDLLEGDDD